MTAYEMRISDCSSDVCSSDLDRARRLEVEAGQRAGGGLGDVERQQREDAEQPDGGEAGDGRHRAGAETLHDGETAPRDGGYGDPRTEESRVGKERCSTGSTRWETHP